jgi:hypothetical protein
MDDAVKRIEKLNRFLRVLDQWEETGDPELRAELNRTKASVQREVVEAECSYTITISPPPAVGGMIMRNVNPFDIIFQKVYLQSLNSHVRDMIHQTIGAIEEKRDKPQEIEEKRNEPEVIYKIQKGYVFVAMPIGPASPFDDVLDSIKEVCDRCGLTAERVDEAQVNERITDRILESIQKAEFVVVDLTESRPNVFYEAGYAQGIGKLPVYIARKGTELEFDLKDYPVIFFESYRELKQGLEARLHALSRAGT